MNTGIKAYTTGCSGFILTTKLCSYIATTLVLRISRYDKLDTVKQQFKFNIKNAFLPILDYLKNLVFYKFGNKSVDLIYTAIYESRSNILLHFPNSKECLLFTDIQQWYTPNPYTNPTPIHTSTRKLFSLKTIYIIDALNTIAKGSDATKKNEVLKFLQNNKDIALKKGKKTAGGIYASEECQSAIDYITNNHTWDCDYSALIPIGAHIAYEFHGHILHHAIYIGFNLFVEMRNFSTKEGIISSINLTSWNDFITRVRNSPSPLYQFEYTNAYDSPILVKRALWCLGTIRYNICTNNCESFIQWVMTNRYESSMCYIPYGGTLAKSVEVLSA